MSCDKLHQIRKLFVKLEMLAVKKLAMFILAGHAKILPANFFPLREGKKLAGKILAVPRNLFEFRALPYTFTIHVANKGSRYVRRERASYSARNTSQRSRERSTATQSIHRTSEKESRYY